MFVKNFMNITLVKCEPCTELRTYEEKCGQGRIAAVAAMTLQLNFGSNVYNDK